MWLWRVVPDLNIPVPFSFRQFECYLDLCLIFSAFDTSDFDSETLDRDPVYLVECPLRPIDGVFCCFLETFIAGPDQRDLFENHTLRLAPEHQKTTENTDPAQRLILFSVNRTVRASEYSKQCRLQPVFDTDTVAGGVHDEISGDVDEYEAQ